MFIIIPSIEHPLPSIEHLIRNGQHLGKTMSMSMSNQKIDKRMVHKPHIFFMYELNATKA